MVDTAPPRSHLRGPKNYYRNGHRYADGYWPCEKCLYGDNETCKQCIFAVWNVDGIKAGFMPREAHQHAHPDEVKAAIKGSPLMQKFSMDHVEDRAYQEGIQNRKIIRAEELAKLANAFLESRGIKGIRVNAENVRQMLGRSPIENQQPAAGSLPLLPMLPGVPHGTMDRIGQTQADPADVSHALQSLYRSRQIIDH